MRLFSLDRSAVAAIARQEWMVSVRNKWTLVFTIVFSALTLAITLAGMQAEGYSGVQDFSRTTASLLNLILYVVPLVALILGTSSFAGEKSSAELLFAQPVSRMEIIVGKMLGLFGSLAASLCLGFATAGVLIVTENGGAEAGPYLALVAFSLILAFVFIGLAAAISAANPRTSRALGISLVAWFFFVVLYDVIVLGLMGKLGGPTGNTVVFLSLIGNPVDVVRVATLMMLDNASMLGASGAALLRFFGGGVFAWLYLALTLTFWSFVPVFVAGRFLNRRDL